MITIFTPTFNRENMLKRLYESLKNQTIKDFEWVIVDDGSTDNTKNLIESFIKEDLLSIVYKKTENHGKMSAINDGVKLASGELFFIVDSDDYLDTLAVESIEKELKFLPKSYAGIVFRKIEIFENGEITKKNKSFGSKWIDSDPIDIFYNRKIMGDKAEIIKTEVMKKFPFPDIENEKFIPEGYIWNRIGETYKFRYVDIGIYYFQYLEDGYTKNFKNIMKKNPKGLKIYYRYMLKKKIPLRNKIKFLVRLIQVAYYEKFQ